MTWLLYIAAAYAGVIMAAAVVAVFGEKDECHESWTAEHPNDD